MVEVQTAALAGLEKERRTVAQTKARLNIAQKRLKSLEWEHEVRLPGLVLPVCTAHHLHWLLCTHV